MLADGQKVLVHQDELGDRVSGLVAGFLLWAGMVDTGRMPSRSSSSSCTASSARSARQLVTIAQELTETRVTDRDRTSWARGLRRTAARCPRSSSGPQPLEVDLDFISISRLRRQSDALDDTVDYGALCADRRAGDRRPSGSRCSSGWRNASPRCRWPTTAPPPVTVTVRKLRPPVPQHSRPPVSIRAVAMTAGLEVAPAPRRCCSGWVPTSVIAGEPPRRGRLAARGGRRLRSYETEPVGGPSGQGPYLNLVVEIETDASARQLLGICHRLESAAGRVRGERWGPRTLDVDILWIDGETVDEPDLQVPHPRMCERRFVLAPLDDLAPDLVPHGWEDVDGWVTPVEPL